MRILFLFTLILFNISSFSEILHDDFSNAIEGIYKQRSAETVEKFETFLEKNPSLAKTMRYGVEGINGVLMASGVKGLLTSGLPKALVALGFGEALSTASSWAGGKVEGMVAEVATSESEAQRFMKALKTCAGTAGVVVGVKIATKSLKASKIQPPVIKDALSERPIIKGGKVWLGETELGAIALLEKPKMVKHHIFNKFRGQSEKSQRYRDFFAKHDVDVDSFSIEVTESTHVSKIHVARHNWTTQWKRWIDANPNATTKEVYQFAGKMMDEYGVSHIPLKPYK